MKAEALWVKLVKREKTPEGTIETPKIKVDLIITTWEGEKRK